jgi:MFS family permease
MKPDRRAALPFILITVFLDVLGIGVVIPVLPVLVGEFTKSRDLQSYWYGALVASYGVMQFLSAPLLGALSDRCGRRPVLLVSIFGLGCNWLCKDWRARFGCCWWRAWLVELPVQVFLLRVRISLT